MIAMIPMDRPGAEEGAGAGGLGHCRNCVQVPLQLFRTCAHRASVALSRVRALFPLNASDPMEIDVDRITTAFKLEQYANA